MTKVFLTGATGYIGGSVLSLLAESHPEYAVRALVRDGSKGKLVTDAFAKVEIVEGELDDVDTITREASNADIVVHLARVFLTGATGYIGGSVLSLLAESHPEYAVRALVRDGSKGKLVTDAFAKVEIVEGELDDVDTITREASNADIVVHLATTGHLKSVETIHKALSSRAAQKPAHWIQISGASALAAGEVADKARSPGEASDLVFNDLAGIAELRSFIQGHPSRGVDNYIIKVAADEPKINTALVFPPIIYGKGTGPVNRRSVQIPSLAKATLDRRRGVQVGRGLSRWGNVHVQDVSRLIFRLVEKAAEAKGEEQVWNSNGLYLTGVGEIPFGEISKLVAAAAADQGLIPTSEVDVVGPEEANSLLPHGAVLYGTNARSEALRGREVLGWAPSGESLENEIPRAVAEEASARERSNL